MFEIRLTKSCRDEQKKTQERDIYERTSQDNEEINRGCRK